MNQMKCDRKSWEDIRIQVSLCQMNTFIGTNLLLKCYSVLSLPFILKSGLYVQFLQTYSLSYETIVNILRAELQHSNYLVISWPFPSFLFMGQKWLLGLYIHISSQVRYIEQCSDCTCIVWV